MEAIKVGGEAPDFDLPGDGGQAVSLSSHRGRNVVLFFYPKDDTAGCTAEAIDFSALKPEFDRIGAVLIGISPDSVKSHDKFKAKHAITVRLASDEDRRTIERYGLWVEKNMYGRKYMGVERTTVLVGPDGRIRQIWNKVKVRGHARAVLDAVAASV